jgi:hypothetical protein
LPAVAADDPAYIQIQSSEVNAHTHTNTYAIYLYNLVGLYGFCTWLRIPV